MHRFYVAPEHWNPDSPLLSGSEAHHARDVLRMKPGDKAVLFNGRGRELTAEALEIGRNQLRFRKLHETETPPLRCRITLGQAIPKGKNMDLIVQKAVELGAAGIAPLISERTIVDLDRDEAVQKQAKWQQVAIEAAKQCGQNWLPRVEPAHKLKDFFSSSSVVAGVSPASSPGFDLRLIASLQSDAQPLKKILAEYAAHQASRADGGRRAASHAEAGRRRVGASTPGLTSSPNDLRPTDVLMLIGPEGDFTPAELALAKTHGCQPITLGPIILRVETAAIYCLSILSYELLTP
jgi:16S rRNA (uracil1498-N3)-methyltransferase